MKEHSDSIWSLLTRTWIFHFYQLNIKNSWNCITTCEGIKKEQLQNKNHQLILCSCIFTHKFWEKRKTVVVCIGMCSNNNIVSLALWSSPSTFEATKSESFSSQIAVLLCMRNKTHYTMSVYTNLCLQVLLICQRVMTAHDLTAWNKACLILATFFFSHKQRIK